MGLPVHSRCGVPHPIPYQGSKRWIAKAIASCFPKDTATLFEPFAGSSAVSLGAAYWGRAKRFHISDINEPLVRLWDSIVNDPHDLAAKYRALWEEQQADPRQHYDHVRDLFNANHRPEHFLYLLARCVKAAIRYNTKGEFNNSPDNRRRGRTPTP